jgi:hypothetical protein
MWDWIALQSNQISFLLGLGLYFNPDPIPKGCRPCNYWVLDRNKPQYRVLGSDLSMQYEFFNKLGLYQRLIQFQYPVLGLILI